MRRRTIATGSSTPVKSYLDVQPRTVWLDTGSEKSVFVSTNTEWWLNY